MYKQLESPQDMLNVKYDVFNIIKNHVNYAIASTQRSGSTKLCLDFWSTGALGMPWEYFNMPHMRPLFERYGARNIRNYVKAIYRNRRTMNGVFGHKIFISTFMLADFAGLGLSEAVLPERVVFLRRRDKVAQARSLVRALATQNWVGTPDQPDPEASAEELRSAFRYICWQEALWEQTFAARRISPLRIWFEDHLAAPEASIAKVAELVGRSPIGQPVPVPRTNVQARSATTAAPFDIREALSQPFTRRELDHFARNVRHID